MPEEPGEHPPLIDPNHFRSVMGCFATGVAVVSGFDGERAPQGATVSSFCSISLEPPLAMVCLSPRSRTLHAISESKVMGISFLASDQAWIAHLFATDAALKFGRVGYRLGPLGTPLLTGAIGHAECEVVQELVLGDHVAVIAAVINGSVSQRDPLLRFRRQYGDFEADQPAFAEAGMLP